MNIFIVLTNANKTNYRTKKLFKWKINNIKICQGSCLGDKLNNIFVFPQSIIDKNYSFSNQIKADNMSLELLNDRRFKFIQFAWFQKCCNEEKGSESIFSLISRLLRRISQCFYSLIKNLRIAASGLPWSTDWFVSVEQWSGCGSFSDSVAVIHYFLNNKKPCFKY